MTMGVMHSVINAYLVIWFLWFSYGVVGWRIKVRLTSWWWVRKQKLPKTTSTYRGRHV